MEVFSEMYGVIPAIIVLKTLNKSRGAWINFSMIRFTFCPLFFFFGQFDQYSYFYFDLPLHEWTNWHLWLSRQGKRVVIHLLLCGFHSSGFTNAASLSDLCGFAADFCGLSHLYLCRPACQTCLNWSHHCASRMNTLNEGTFACVEMGKTGKLFVFFWNSVPWHWWYETYLFLNIASPWQF